MEIIRWVIISVFFLFNIIFAFYNLEETASVRFFNLQSPVLPLYIYLFIAFLAGFLFWLCISMTIVFQHKRSINHLRKENRKIKEELDRLRNLGIEEESPPEAVQEEKDNDQTQVE